MENKLEKRMYFLVPYNISPIQQAIQAGHSMGEYALKYGRYNPDHLIWEFLEEWKTWIILNGGTTNNRFDLQGVAQGTLNQYVQDILEFNSANPDLKIEHATFIEPDINDALTALCLIVDERVFNRDDYPDFDGWVVESEIFVSAKDEENWKILKEEYVKEVGEDIAFLKELLNTKILA